MATPYAYAEQQPKSFQFTLNAPAPALRPYIFAYAFLQAPAPQHHAAVEPLLPAGTITLHFDLADPVVGYHPNYYQQVAPSAYFLGQTSVPHGVQALGQLQHLSVVFYPTGFSRLMGLPAAELTDRLETPEMVLGRPGRELNERLHQPAPLSVHLRCLDAFFLRNLSCCKTLPGSADYALQLWQDQAGSISLTETRAKLKVSERHFRRLFREAVGLAPKLYLRLRQFHRALYLKQQQPRLDLDDLCYLGGYCDYPHLSKAFNAFAGQSPRTYYTEGPRHVIREKLVLWEGG